MVKSLVPSNVGGSEAQEGLKSELVDLAHEMSVRASEYREVLSADNKRLDKTGSTQQQQIDLTAAQHGNAKKLIWAGQLSFYKTMLLLVIGVLLFLFMLIFIYITS
eukprot:GHVS01059814.1.p1 GENE.GHVS01059814.1~~GHVS01059814.1.p1  ORF type:complete len:106 (-),score=24.75 GHVS01059814.1:1587-1904(-)